MRKQTLILIGIAIVLLIIYLVSRSKTPVKREAEYFVKVDSAAIQKIEIGTGENLVVLEKRSDKWWVTNPMEYPANAQFTSDLVSKLSDLQIENLISEQADKQELFEVNGEKGTKVAIYAGGKEPSTIIIGKMNDNYRHTYMRKADSDKIYLIKGVYKSYLTRKVKDWRDKTIASYDKDQLQGFVFTYPNKTFELTKSDTEWTVKSGTEQFVADKGIVERLLNMVHNLQCFDFMDSLDTRLYDFSKPAFQLKITTTSDQFTLKLLPEDKEAKKYIVEKEGAITHFVIYESTAKVLMKDIDEFRPKPKDEKKEI
jgi:hypothetical protein